MNKDITYCANTKCKKKYKCNLYKGDYTDSNGEEFWFTIYNPEDCPNKK